MSMTAVDLPMDIRDAAFVRRSARATPWQLTYVRDLTEADLALMLGPVAVAGNPKAPLASIRAPHHMMARMVAAGKPPVEISNVMGYSLSRIYTLQRDPAFQELVAHYEAEEVMAHANVQAQITHVGLTAMAVLQERLEADPDQFSNKDLLSIKTASLDRIGHGPSSTIKLTTDPTAIIAQVKAELQAESGGRVLSKAEVIDCEYESVPTPEASNAEACSGPAEGPADD